MFKGLSDPLDFADEDFTALVETAGQSVWWVPSGPCSCYGYYRGEKDRALTYDPDCPQHDEAGYQYRNAQWITGAIFQRMRQDITYTGSAQNILGSGELLLFPLQMDGSENPAYAQITDHDLIIAPEATTTISEPIPIGQRRLTRPVVRIVTMMLNRQVVDPALYRVVGGEIEWGPSLLQSGGTVAVTWEYHPIYTLLTAMPNMRVWAQRSWPRKAMLQERTVMGYSLWNSVAPYVPGWGL